MKKFFTISFSVILITTLIGLVSIVTTLYWYGQGLPDYRQLRDYKPSVTSRIYADSGCLLGEYATEKRLFVPYEAIPSRVRHAFISAEDGNFWHHYGIDALPLLRAVVYNVIALWQNKRPQGASTITQQVAKNFFLTNEVSFERKIKEAILALRIERALEKEKILELYLNEIYLGYGSYGIAAAALNYFDSSLDRLNISQAAFLAALPKAPNNYHPQRFPERALERRNWVLSRMLKEDYINASQYAQAAKKPITIQEWKSNTCKHFSYFSGEVRKRLTDLYGNERLYHDGLTVHTSLDRQLQETADDTLRQALIKYDRKYGWRGPIGQIPTLDPTFLPNMGPSIRGWSRALVRDAQPQSAALIFEDGSSGVLPLSEVTWARQQRDNGKKGPKITRLDQVLQTGDAIWVEKISRQGTELYTLRQIPEVSGGIVAIDPHSGRVLAMSGGFSWNVSQFNRVTQALRQPGSAFKPLVYLAALEEGFQPNSIILDAPFVIDQGDILGRWKPKNYTGKFYGPSPMRIGLEKSRNLMTIRLAQAIGMEKIVEKAHLLGVKKDMPKQLSMALGAGETRLIDLTAAYSVFVNGGKRITPTLIDRVQDRHGRTIRRKDNHPCADCRAAWYDGQPPPYPEDRREQIIDPVMAYQITSMLEGVVQRGTGRVAKSVGKPLGGKTGTTNDNRDAWFIGFAPDLAVGIYVGFDQPRSLGKKENGATLAAPIFRDFMQAALVNRPAIPFRIPSGVRLVRLDPKTGRRATSNQSNTILEALPGESYSPDHRDRKFVDSFDPRYRKNEPQGLY